MHTYQHYEPNINKSKFSNLLLLYIILLLSYIETFHLVIKFSMFDRKVFFLKTYVIIYGTTTIHNITFTVPNTYDKKMKTQSMLLTSKLILMQWCVEF